MITRPNIKHNFKTNKMGNNQKKSYYINAINLFSRLNLMKWNNIKAFYKNVSMMM